MSSSLRFTGNRDADDLLNNNPLALLIGMLLDQQFPIERAFLAPLLLQERLGKPLNGDTPSQMSPDSLADLFAEKPALHRFPKSMGARTHSLCLYLVDEYAGIRFRCGPRCLMLRLCVTGCWHYPVSGKKGRNIYRFASQKIWCGTTRLGVRERRIFNEWFPFGSRPRFA